MRTRILIVNVPRMLSDILKGLANQDEDLEIVGDYYDELGFVGDLATTVEQTNADVLVLGSATTQLSDEGEQLLLAQPRLRILALQAEDRNAQVYNLRPERMHID